MADEQTKKRKHVEMEKSRRHKISTLIEGLRKELDLPEGISKSYILNVSLLYFLQNKEALNEIHNLKTLYCKISEDLQRLEEILDKEQFLSQTINETI